ncbi:unknown similar to AMEV006 [Mythimna separata entomopoxvirus 'L']|uniref:Uncharacterized protein n=1 Tax=Mythimna separata entomopoxvirus 'L' TaxID=1293572 RepID=A0A916KPZ8_9POXV|nr:unknown similar to AMEV006 [Mythimna separata entomopoxvirus 'L']CCU56209.1 unknown similar to AMEV006 [Mythimna separata entomopoxvirus 'L']
MLFSKILKYINFLKNNIIQSKYIKMYDNINYVNIIKYDINNNIEFEYTMNNILTNNYNNLTDAEICELYAQVKIDLEYINLKFKQIDNINLQIINNHIHTEINEYCINKLYDSSDYDIFEIMALESEYFI